MTCPFFRRTSSLPRQSSIVGMEHSGMWTLEEEELPDDALTLTHLQMAIQLLTAPSVRI